ncbi:hypothetical protein P3T76_009764 [Phytophthora citrophthora]|uniref:Uncharacterized protein n=1 Tax=Phytophthora citrophthora TaxID=4793 RepID=A0AAD9GEF8_9STRA|nr:hypothetical protein P3T76_009764 [Phytophthora citrophthora]
MPDVASVVGTLGRLLRNKLKLEFAALPKITRHTQKMAKESKGDLIAVEDPSCNHFSCHVETSKCRSLSENKGSTAKCGKCAGVIQAALSYADKFTCDRKTITLLIQQGFELPIDRSPLGTKAPNLDCPTVKRKSECELQQEGSEALISTKHMRVYVVPFSTL